jgi:hypothetical protein
MNRSLFAFLPVFALLVSGCSTPGHKPTASSKPAPASTQPPPSVAPSEPAPAQPPSAPAETPTPDPYTLHHRVFPNLLFKTEGKFFASLHAGEFEQLREIIAESYGPAYTNAMRMKSVSQPDIVFITFAEPARSPLCYHVALAKKGDTFLYFTLEKSDDILEIGIKTAFCGRSPEGDHLNYGPRKYTSLTEFEEEVRAFLARQETPEPAATTTPQ